MEYALLDEGTVLFETSNNVIASIDHISKDQVLVLFPIAIL